MYGHVNKQGVSSNEDVNICARHFVTLILRLASFCHFFLRLEGHRVLLDTVFVRLFVYCLVWDGRASVRSQLCFCCTTCNLWLTSASSALLLTALLHCFRHIKQCRWSLSLVTNPHYLFPRIYVLFLTSSVCFHDLLLFKRTAFLRARVCFGMEVEPGCV